MKILVKTLKGTRFAIEVNLEDTIVDVKKKIECLQGQDVYPAAHQMLIHQGQILKDDTTLKENKVSEDSFIIIMLSKVAVKRTTPPPTPVAAPPPATVTPPIVNASSEYQNNLVVVKTTTTPPTPWAAPPLPATVTPPIVNASSENNLERSVQQILEMGGGTWDRYTVFHALRAAYNNPERAVEYLYSGLPDTPEIPPAAGLPPPVAGSQPVNPLPREPHANPLNNFPHELEEEDLHTLLFYRPGNWSITNEEVQAIERLAAMGFDKSRVIDVFFASDKNEELAANYLLDHMHDFQ